MQTYTTAVSYLATSFSYSKEITALTSYISQNHITFTDGHFIDIQSVTFQNSFFTSFSANETQTVSTLQSFQTISGSNTHDHVQGATTVQSSNTNSRQTSAVEHWTINRTLTSFERSYFESADGGTAGTTVSFSSTASGSTTAGSTTTYLQVTTTTKSAVETFRLTTTTSSAYLSTSVAGTVTVIYYPTTTGYTTITGSSTITQDGRIFSTTFTSTSVRAQFLMRTIVVCEPAFYSLTVNVSGNTVTQTGGNEVLLVPTTTIAGLQQWEAIGTTADSTEFGSWSVAPISLMPFGMITTSSTAIGLIDPGGGAFSTASITSVYYIVTNSYTMHSILPTAASDTFSFHATRFVSSTSTATFTSYTEAGTTFTGTSLFTGGSTFPSYSSSFTGDTIIPTATVTVTNTSTNGSTSTGTTTFSQFTTSSGSFGSGGGIVTGTASYSAFVSTGTTTYTTTEVETVTSTYSSSYTAASSSTGFSYTASYTSSSITASGTFTTTSTSAFSIGTTTTTSAMSNDYLPFQTDSTTTSITGFIELYTTSALFRRTTTTSTSHATTMPTGAFNYTTTVINSTLLVNTIETTIQIPGSYHKESTTITVITTILSKYFFTSNAGQVRRVMADGLLPTFFHETNIFTMPSHLTYSSYSHTHLNTGTAFTQIININGITAGSTAEGMAGNGIVVRADLNFNGVFAAAAGSPFNVHPCMAIGFRPATNDALSAPIYFSPTFNVGTLSMSAWSKFTTTTTVGTSTVSTTDSSTISTIQTLSTVPFSHISLHQGASASLFVSMPFTESRTVARSYTSVWGSYTTRTTTSTRTTSTSTDATTMNTTAASLVTHASPFVVTETTISLFSGNTIFITRSAPAVFLTNDGGNRYISHDERFGTPSEIITTQTYSILIAFGASVTDSTHLRNERGSDPLLPRAFGGFHPITTQTGYAIMGLEGNTWYTTTNLLIVGAAWKMTVSPRSGGASTTTTTTMTMYSISENHTMGAFEILLTNDLSNIHAIEPLTAVSITLPPLDGNPFIIGIEGTPFFSTTSRFPFRPEDSTHT